MRALEFIKDHVTFKLPYDFSYQMKTPFIILQFLQYIKVHDFILPLKLYNQPQIWIVKDQKCFCFIQNLKTLCPNHHRYHQDEKNNFDTEIWCEVDDEFQYNVAMPR